MAERAESDGDGEKKAPVLMVVREGAIAPVKKKMESRIVRGTRGEYIAARWVFVGAQ